MAGFDTSLSSQRSIDLLVRYGRLQAVPRRNGCVAWYKLGEDCAIKDLFTINENKSAPINPWFKGCVVYRVPLSIAYSKPTAKNLQQYAVSEVVKYA